MKILLALLLVGTAIALPKKVLVVGDSMSEEYRVEIPFSAPASDLTDSNTAVSYTHLTLPTKFVV